MSRVADLNYYARWNPWQMMEPGSKMDHQGRPANAGTRILVEAAKRSVRGGLILRSIDQKHVHFDLEFIKPWKSLANDNWLFEEWGNGETKVTWQNQWRSCPIPLARLMGPLPQSRTLNKQFEEGLRNLKKLCEGL